MSEKTYDNRGRFAIFLNDKKREGKKDADMKGTYTDLDGIEYWMDAWRGKKADGSIYYSGSIKPKGEAKAGPRRAASPKTEESDW
jgi:hypothetical protein